MRKTSKMMLVAAAAASLASGSLFADVSLKTSGYVTGFYQANLNNLGDIRPALGNNSNVNANEFSFGAGQLSLVGKDSANGVGGELDILYSPIISLSNAPIEQAFVDFNAGPVGFKFGKFFAGISAESLDVTNDLNYSRSILFGAVPTFLNGLAVNYSIAGLGITGLIANNTDEKFFPDATPSDSADLNGKDLGVSLNYSLAGVGLTATYLLEPTTYDAFGNKLVSMVGSENNDYLDVVVKDQLMDNLGLQGEYLYKTHIASADTLAGNAQGSSVTDPSTGNQVAFSPKQQGYALYVNYATPVSGLSLIPRYEQLFTPDKGGSVTEINEGTITLKYVTGALAHSLEWSHAYTTTALFPVYDGKYLYNADTLTYAATYSF